MLCKKNPCFTAMDSSKTFKLFFYVRIRKRSKPLPAHCFKIQIVKNPQLVCVPSASDAHSVLDRFSDQVASCFAHCAQQLFFGGANIKDPCSLGMHVDRRIPKPQI